MFRNRMGRFSCLPAVVTIVALLIAPCAGAGNVKKTQMGGSIQGAPLSLAGVTSTIAGFSQVGSQDGAGVTARFNSPYSITTDGSRLYISETTKHTIRKVVISTAEVTTLTGKAGLSGSADGAGAAARFYKPFGLTTDGTSLYVADTFNNTIREID